MNRISRQQRDIWVCLNIGYTPKSWHFGGENDDEMMKWMLGQPA